MRRLADADAKLAAWARARIGQPLAYGFTDCIVLAAEAVDVQAGTDLAAGARGLWETEAQGIAYMLKHRTDPVQELVRAGLSPKRPGFQQPGDLLIAESLHDANAAEKRLRNRLGIGFMRAHVCLGRHALSVLPDGHIGLVDTVAVMEKEGYAMHVLRVGG